MHGVFRGACRASRLAVTTLLAAGALTSSAAQEPVSDSDRVLSAARETMAAADDCFLITLDASGHPQARLVDAFEPESDMAVWIGTLPSTRKVGELRADPRATLAYHDAEGAGYVVLIGRARLVDDLEERRRRWKQGWEAFWPDGPEGEGYLLVEFTPSRIEVMSFARGIMEAAFKPAILFRREGRWVLAGD